MGVSGDGVSNFIGRKRSVAMDGFLRGLSNFGAGFGVGFGESLVKSIMTISLSGIGISSDVKPFCRGNQSKGGDIGIIQLTLIDSKYSSCPEKSASRVGDSKGKPTSGCGTSDCSTGFRVSVLIRFSASSEDGMSEDGAAEGGLSEDATTDLTNSFSAQGAV